MPDIALELVRTGFHGLALVMLYLGYRLLATILSRKSADVVGDAMKVEAGRHKVVTKFMIISLVFFVLGVGSELYRHSQAYTLTIAISPSVLPNGVESPTLLKLIDLKTVSFADGPEQITVRNDEAIMFQLDAMTAEIVHLQEVLGSQAIERVGGVEGVAGAVGTEGGLDDI